MRGGSLLIQGGRIIDPSQGIDMVGDLLIMDGEVAGVGLGSLPGSEQESVTVRAGGMVVCPGFIDLHCHLREPGFEEKETVATGAMAATRGGFTTVCCMPNTRPPIDSPTIVEYIRKKAGLAGAVRVLPIGCITRGQQGEELVEMKELAEAGVVAFSDDGRSVPDGQLMRRALEWARSLGLPISDHCEDSALTRGGVMNEGRVAAEMGLKGMPVKAETTIVARDIDLAQFTGARLHIAHVSSAASVDLIRRARGKGVNITAEVTAHHLTLSEERVSGYDTNAKVNPPLRTEADRKALIDALREGIIEAIATDHAPHTILDKGGEFNVAAFGISGLETALGVLLGLVHQGELDLVTLVSRLTEGPARLFPALRDLGTLKVGAPGDVAIFDPDLEWLVDPALFASKGKNNPWVGQSLIGKVVATVVGGEIKYRDDAVRIEGEGR